MVGNEIVGFSLLFITSTYLTKQRMVREELIFIRADHRSAEAELKLHSLAHEAFDKLRPGEGYLVVPPTEYALEVRANLERVGYRISSARMAYRAPAEAAATDTVGGAGAKKNMH